MSLSESSIDLQRNFTALSPTDKNVYEFESFRLDAAHLMLYKDDVTVSLKPKVVETLVALVERAGSVISKGELMDRLWQDSFVGETNLSQNVYLLRKTLGNCADGRPLIETFRRRGYRFNGEVRLLSDNMPFFFTRTKTLVVTEEDDESSSAASELKAVADLGRSTDHDSGVYRSARTILLKFIPMIGAIAAAAIVITGAGLILRSGFGTDDQDKASSTVGFSNIKMTRMTPDLNIEHTALSPDGEYLAYSLIEKGRASLWIKDIQSGTSNQLLPPSDAGYAGLGFSRDSLHLYYTQSLETSPNGTIFRVPAFGGEPRLVARNTFSPPTISPDGKQVAFVRGNQLMISDIEASTERILSKRDGASFFYESWDSRLSWSPDGNRIAVSGLRPNNSGGRRHELVEVSVEDGSERTIPIPEWDYLDDVQWLNDQTGLIARAREKQASPWQIYLIAYPDGSVTRITNDLNNYDNPTISSDGQHVLVRKHTADLHIWMVQLSSARLSTQITFGSSAHDGGFGIAFAPERRIVYTSPRGGNIDLWSMSEDGSDQRQLTKNSGDFNGDPQLTRDSQAILFLSSRTGLKRVWRMDLDGGNPSQFVDTPENAETNHVLLSADNAWVYLDTFQDGKDTIRKDSFAAREPQVLKESCWPLSLSPNGKVLVVGFYDPASPKPWKLGSISAETGETLRIYQESFRVVRGWTPDSGSMIVVRDKDPSDLWLQPVGGGEPQKLTNFEDGIIRNFAISPDFTKIAVARSIPSTEAVLISF